MIKRLFILIFERKKLLEFFSGMRMIQVNILISHFYFDLADFYLWWSETFDYEIKAI